MSPLGPPAPTQPPLLGHGVAPPFYNVCILICTRLSLCIILMVVYTFVSFFRCIRQTCSFMNHIPHAQGKRNPSKMVGVARGHQRVDTLKPYSQKTSQSNHTRTTALSNSMKPSHACRATQDRRVMVERSDRTWSTGEGNGKPLQYSCLENPINSMKRKN